MPLSIEDILQSHNEFAFTTNDLDVPARFRPWTRIFVRTINAGDYDVEAARFLADVLFERGRVDETLRWSMHCVIESDPKVGNYGRMLEFARRQEEAASKLADKDESNGGIAAAQRHRGCMHLNEHQAELALSCFRNAWELQSTAQNFSNVLCAFVQMGKEAHAKSLLAAEWPRRTRKFRKNLRSLIAHDLDLTALREEPVLGPNLATNHNAFLGEITK